MDEEWTRTIGGIIGPAAVQSVGQHTPVNHPAALSGFSSTSMLDSLGIISIGQMDQLRMCGLHESSVLLNLTLWDSEPQAVQWPLQHIVCDMIRS